MPYVSSLQRHLATRPGWLEWAWALVRPAFVDGTAQTRAWQLATELEVRPLPSLSRSALRVLGVDAAGEQAIRDVCDSFIRVSPTNLMLSGLLRQVLEGDLPPASPRKEYGAVLEVLNRYRVTSPEMVVLGTLVRDALPGVRNPL